MERRGKQTEGEIWSNTKHCTYTKYQPQECNICTRYFIHVVHRRLFTFFNLVHFPCKISVYHVLYVKMYDNSTC